MRKKTAVLIITFMTAAVVGLGVFAWTSARQARKLEYYARANTQHAFSELVTSMGELSTALRKSVYVSDPALEAALCTQVFGRAITAQMALGELPYSSEELEQTAGFVSRVGDYACSLARTVGGSGGYTEEELESLTSLSDMAQVLAQNLTDMQRQILDGALTMAEVYGSAAQAGAQDEQLPTAEDAFRDIESAFPEMPTLLYDGPFSDSRTTGQAKLLEGQKEVDEAEAAAAAAELLGTEADNVSVSGECAGDLPCWICTARAGGGEYTAYVTKQGGVVQSVLCSRLPGGANYSVEDALDMAEDYLRRSGLENMEESYHIVQGNVLTVNYVYEQDGTLCYPDLVKLGVALDNGMLASYDARSYIDSHGERRLSPAAYSEQEAAAQVQPPLQAEKTRLAVIPTEGGREILCYEILCQGVQEDRCLLYVNAQTGAQEKIMLLVEDENGALAI